MEPTEEAALVESAQTGDAAAFVRLFDSCFDSVYDFATRLTRDRHAGAAVAEAAFVAAMSALPGLPAGASFRARVFAFARRAAFDRLERMPTPRTGSETVEAAFAAIDGARLASPADAARARPLAPIVLAGSSALDPAQRSLLDLCLRQGLDHTGIAAVLGISANNALVLVARLQAMAESRLAAFVLSRLGRDDCPGLAAALAKIDSSAASPGLRRAVGRHVALCPGCEERLAFLVSPLVVFASLAPIAPPVGVRENVLDRLMREWSANHVVRPLTNGAEGRSGAVPVARGAGEGNAVAAGPTWLLAGLGTAVALLVAALLLPASPFALGGSARGGKPSPASGLEPPGTAAGTPTPRGSSATATSTRPGSPFAGATFTGSPPTPPTSAATTPAPTPGRTQTATSTVPAPTPSVTSSPAPAPTATAAPTPTTVPCVPRLATNGISQIQLAPGASGSFFVYDAGLCGPLAFATSAPSWLRVAPATGSFGTGGMAEITVTAPGTGLAEGPHVGVVSVAGVPAGGQQAVSVTVTVTGDPPVVLSAICTAADGTWTVAVQAADDFAVTSVAFRYTAATGSALVPMSGPDGSQSGTWNASLPAISGAHSFTVTARDAAGQAGSAAIADCS